MNHSNTDGALKLDCLNSVYDLEASFIIPCYNGQKYIELVINSIKLSFNNHFDKYEIILVDNGSEDESAKIAKKCGVKVVESDAGTVSGVRNDGVKVARGRVLVFIDADVEIDHSWCEVFLNRIKLMHDSRFVTGSHCVVPDYIREPFFTWYKSIEKDDRNTHLGSGHLIISRSLFDEIGGFNDSLKSGEDYDLCQRARQAGVPVYTDRELVAWHLGYPDRAWGFIVRECWHGASDFSTFYYFIKSKVAVLSVIFALAQTAIVIGIFSGSVTFVQMLIFFTFLVLSTLVYSKFGFQNFKAFSYNVCVAYLYLLGRASSVIYPILKSKKNE